MATKTVTIDAAFLQEIKEDHAQLRTLLCRARRVCEAALQTNRSPRQLASLFAKLLRQLALHFSLEEDYGYFDQPLSVAPHLSARADRLRKEHCTLYDEAFRLTQTATELCSSNGKEIGLRDLASSFLDFYDRLRKHESGENELILEAYAVDIGVGD